MQIGLVVHGKWPSVISVIYRQMTGQFDQWPFFENFEPTLIISATKPKTNWPVDDAVRFLSSVLPSRNYYCLHFRSFLKPRLASLQQTSLSDPPLGRWCPARCCTRPKSKQRNEKRVDSGFAKKHPKNKKIEIKAKNN